MLTLGLAGGLDPVYDNFLDSPDNYTYDGAAVLVKDGKVIAAIEEERLDRIKRSNKFPLQAIQFCLEAGGIGARDLDRIAYYVDERDANALLSHLYLHRPDIEPKLDARSLFAAMLGRGLGVEVDPARLRFYPHCLMHGIGVMDQSGFEESLVLVIDEVGGMFRGQREKDGSVRLYPIADLPPAKSLSRFCGALFPFFGYGNFDEYKVMMLAPYGDPATYQELVGNLYDLLPNGDYLFHLDRVRALIGKIEPRRRDQEPAQAHRDLAASLQSALERIVLHVVRHHREATGQRNLCIAGGMAENSVTNGKVLQSNLFDRVFVHPAAYDAGCALGAALAASYEQPGPPRGCGSQVYWGVDVGEDTRLAKELGNWSGLLNSERVPNVADYTARLIEQGAVAGWMQGTSEFGTHSLGNRNVLADPRCALSIERVRKALRLQDAWWPFAPAVLEEDATGYFELPAESVSFLKTFAVRVRDDKRSLLPATTHADGTARLHVVSRQANPAFWALIKAFRDLTGVPVLLATSLNIASEPTVASLEQGIVSFLTSGLDYLVVGDFVATKRAITDNDLLPLRLSLPPYVQVFRSQTFLDRVNNRVSYELRTSCDSEFRRAISAEMSDLLMRVRRPAAIADLLAELSNGASRVELLAELNRLWSERLVVMSAPEQQCS